MERITTSAALYFEPQPAAAIPFGWLAVAVRFLSEAGLPIQEFAINVIQGDIDGMYSYKADHDLLIKQLERGNVGVLGLYSNPAKDRKLMMDWRGLAYFDMTRGDCFLGVPQAPGHSLAAHLCSAYDFYKDFVPIHYGYAYDYPALCVPDFYAVGILSGPNDFSAAGRTYGHAVARWFDELFEQRRHLRGYFRSVYPANLLSDAHLDAPMGNNRTLRTDGVGRLTLLDDGRWLWEVPDKRLAAARDALSRSGLILSA